MNLRGKKVLVVGLGRTGEALCQFLLSRRAQVKVSDKKNEEELGGKVAFWRKKGVVLETGKHDRQSFLEADLIIPSPGVPPIPELKMAQDQGIPVISEIELACHFLRGRIIGITGSNGKSTTASLAHRILKDGNIPSYLGGNIGTPLVTFVDRSQNKDVFVTEVSSFQLQYVRNFRAYFSVFLNISPDHLDWHSSFADYYEAKKKLITSQRENAVAVLNQDDPLVWALHSKTKARVYSFSRKKRVHPGCFIEDSWVVLSDASEEKLMKTSEIPLFGIHNQENVMAAALIGHLFSLPLSKIKQSIQSFQGLEHRLERITTVEGVVFYNDSKATNVDAALKSIQSFHQEIILIAGGRDKGGDFAKLRRSVEQRVKKLILIGEAKDKIRKALANTVQMEEAFSLEEAVSKGFLQAKPGDVVLLAPACTSFDMFQNFEERGRVFKHAVLGIKKKFANERGK